MVFGIIFQGYGVLQVVFVFPECFSDFTFLKFLYNIFLVFRYGSGYWIFGLDLQRYSL